MTKSQELEALREFIARLPEDSYLRPWLSSVMPEIECEIRSDFVLSPSLAQTRRQCVAELADAKRSGEALITMARQKAEATEQAALKFAQAARDRASFALREAIRTLEH